MWIGGQKPKEGQLVLEEVFAVRLFKPGDEVTLTYKGKTLEGTIIDREPDYQLLDLGVKNPEPFVLVQTAEGVIQSKASSPRCGIRFRYEPKPYGMFIFQTHYRTATPEEEKEHKGVIKEIDDGLNAFWMEEDGDE